MKTRTAAVFALLGGLLWVPGLLHAASTSRGFELDSAGAAELDAIKKKNEPKPYTPANAPGCARWKGRAFIARYDATGKPSGCIAQCEARLSEVNGATGRWEITGAKCASR